MRVEEGRVLRDLTTLRVGGPARYVLTVESTDELVDALAFVREKSVPFVVLGEGSNVLASDEGYEGAVILMRIPGIAFTDAADAMLVTAGAGESWDAFVSACAEQGLWGVENLAGIPGTVGAAPVQNIGAYGMELKDTLQEVIAVNATTGEQHTFDRDVCRFGYRDSRFKHEPELIITSVTFRLAKNSEPRIGYSDLKTAATEGEDLSTPAAIGPTVRTIRARKFPDLSQYGTAGSFFKNPIISQERFVELAKTYGAIPSFPQENGVKVPLAYILDHVLSLRGYRKGPTFLFGNQPLVLVADPTATANDVDALARELESRVREATGIEIEREVRNLDAHECRS
ncbi:MAG: UDP-N-acetylmuramate dehydrogenase [Bacillota bacterium]